MTKYVAFLRAVNVGGRTVKMDQLRRLLEDTGLSGVETFIAPGMPATLRNATTVGKIAAKYAPAGEARA